MREKLVAFILTATLAVITFGAVIAQTYTLGGYSEPFCLSGTCNFYIVYGEDAKPADLVGGSDIIARLAGDSYKLTTTTGTTTATAIEGEEARIDASGNEFNLGEHIYDIDNRLTDTDLPTILADGTFDDNKGTNKGDYEYTQKLEFTSGTGTVKFARKESGDKEADIYLYFDDASSKYMYTYKLDFTTDVPVANAADLEQADIIILGTEYTIVDATASGSVTKLVLMGGTSKVTGSHGETYDVTVGDTTYSVIPYVYGSSNTVIFDVTYGGATETTDALAVGDTHTLDDGNLVGLTQMATSAKEGVADTATFFVGANKVTLQDGQKVKIGDSKVDGTAVSIGNKTGQTSAVGVWDNVSVTYVPQDDIYLANDEEYTDPVFGAFKFMFLGIDVTTEHIDIDPDGSDKIEITATNKDGNTLKFDAFYADSSGNMACGEDADNQVIVKDGDVLNGTDVGGSDISALEGTRFLYDFNNIAHLVEITDIDTTNTQVDFRIIDLGNKDYEDQPYTEGTTTAFTFMDNNFQLVINSTGSANATVVFVDITDNTNGISVITTENGAVIELNETGTYFNITEGDSSISTNASLATAVVNLTWDSTNERININTPTGTVTSHSTFQKLEDGDLYNKKTATIYGTIWNYNSEAQGYVDIDYPDEEADANVYVAEVGATTSTSEGAEAGTTKTPVPLTDAISKLDTEVPNPETVSQHLILVGGSCVNDLVQKLVDDGTLGAEYTCTGGLGAGWETGKGYIWLFEDAFKTGQTVLVVAGTAKEETRVACAALQKYETKLTGITTTSAEVTGSITTPVVTAA